MAFFIEEQVFRHHSTDFSRVPPMRTCRVDDFDEWNRSENKRTSIVAKELIFLLNPTHNRQNSTQDICLFIHVLRNMPGTVFTRA
jgi:hypothetical protein